MSTKEIADLRGIARQTASYWCARGWLKTARRVFVGRWWGWEADLDEVLEFESPSPGPVVARPREIVEEE